MIIRKACIQETISEQPVISFRDCPAKTYYDRNGQRCSGRTVFEHCQIVGEVARALIKRFPPELQMRLFPRGSALVASVHDTGKVSPTFFLKLQKSLSADLSSWLPLLAKFKGVNESQWGGHAGVSALALEDITRDASVARIAGQHHGALPDTGMLKANSPVMGGDEWQEQRRELVLALKCVLNEEFPEIRDHYQSVLLAGLTTVADWIGSGEFFEDPLLAWKPNIERALDHAGFIMPDIHTGLGFGDIFQDSKGKPYQPNQSQRMLYQHCSGAGVYILEAPMGLGKTEAALYAAYQLLERGEASGIYFALPTQLTSNKIYDRFNHFLKTILTAQSPHRQSLLLHGNAWLMAHELGEEGQPGQSWFHSSKRGLLAPFAVGTLDQALMAAMNVRHGFVRAFGLAGKVVILDEVHSYDAYTSVILTELLTLLRSLHCTVIILSATLNSLQRTELLGQSTDTQAYPLITAAPGTTPHPINEYPVTHTEQRKVVVKMMPMAHQSVLEAVLARAEAGEQVLWIENTVAEAQERYVELATRAVESDIACGLLHSRFTPAHRQINEERWVNHFGKTGWSERRMRGRILIGTQVLEQSLDIDADLLVTRFAPTDMLFQRMGRLWRHTDTPRPSSATCQAWILAPDLHNAQENPRTAFGSTASVYAPYILCRSLEVWQQHVQNKGSITLPADIRPRLEATYCERPEQGMLAHWQHELTEGNRFRKGLTALRQLARVTLVKEGVTLPESKAQTRYSEQDTAQLLLLTQLSLDVQSKTTCLRFLDGCTLQLPWQHHRLSRTEWRHLAADILQHVVTCRQSQLPRPLARSWCQKIGLGNVLYLGNEEQEEASLSVALVMPTDELSAADGSASALSSEYAYSYRDDTGLRITKRKE